MIDYLLAELPRPVAEAISRHPLTAEHAGRVDRLARRVLNSEAFDYRPCLTLLALVSLRAVNVSSAYERVRRLDTFWRRLFIQFGFTSLQEFDPDAHLALALSGGVDGVTPGCGNAVISRYLHGLRDEEDWLESVPKRVRNLAAPFLLPRILEPTLLRRHLPPRHVLRPREETLRAETDWLMEHFDKLGAIADHRLAFMTELRQIASKAQGEFTLQGHTFCPAESPHPYQIGVRYLRSDGAPPWFWEIFENKLIEGWGWAPSSIQWLKEQGLAKTHFRSWCPGVLRPTQDFRHQWKKQPCGCFDLEPMYWAVLFGHMAVQFILECGPRVLELCQFPQLPGGRRGPAFSFPAIVKGGRKVSFTFSRRVAEDAFRVADALRLHYGLPADDPLPEVGFRALCRLNHSFPPARYLFQLKHRHLDEQTVTACVRFLLHGIYVRPGWHLNIRCHLLRHGYAKARKQAGATDAQIAERLHHTGTHTVFRYARPSTQDALAAALMVTGMGKKP